jgi:hypothetical protein
MLRERLLRRRLPGVSSESIRRSSSDGFSVLAVMDCEPGLLRETMSRIDLSHPHRTGAIGYDQAIRSRRLD